MSQLVLHPTSEAQWQALVSEAALAADCKLDQDMESYLVFLLMRFTTRPEMAERVMALDYLESLNTSGSQRFEQLRDVGDQCLLYSGLFPAHAARKHVSVDYYVGMGRTAYHQLSEVLQHSIAALYQQIAFGFVHLMDVLHAMRAMDAEHRLEPVLAYDLWEKTGSRFAERVVRGSVDSQAFFARSVKISH